MREAIKIVLAVGAIVALWHFGIFPYEGSTDPQPNQDVSSHQADPPPAIERCMDLCAYDSNR